MTPAEERYIATIWRRLGELEDKVAELIQRQYAGGAAGGSGQSGGTYYADPGAVAINPGEAELLEVWEVAYPTGKLVGDRLVINLMPEPTAEDARLLLSRNRDGSYTAIQQACPVSPGGG